MSTNQRFNITTFTNPGGLQVWRVQGRKADGQRVRENFQTQAEAKARKSALEIEAMNRSIGVSVKQTRLTDEQLGQAEAAFLKLSGKLLLPAVEYYLKHGCSTAVDITIRAAVQQFLAAKATQKRLRQRTLQDYRSRLNPLMEFYGDRTLSLISRADLETLIFKPEQAADTANGNRRVLHALFAWCAKQDFLQVNPVSKIPTTARDDKEPEIMTVAEVKLLFHAAMTLKDGVMLPYAVLSLCMGLRPEEVVRLDWKHIDLEQRIIRIQGEVAKLRQRRIVEMPGHTADWLRTCLGKTIMPNNKRRYWDTVRRLAGFKGSWFKKGDEKLKEWPQDVVRHTAISYHYALGNNEGKTAQWAGNSPETVHRYYKGLVMPNDAQEFWALKPTDFDMSVCGQNQPGSCG